MIQLRLNSSRVLESSFSSTQQKSRGFLWCAQNTAEALLGGPAIQKILRKQLQRNYQCITEVLQRTNMHPARNVIILAYYNLARMMQGALASCSLLAKLPTNFAQSSKKKQASQLHLSASSAPHSSLLRWNQAGKSISFSSHNIESMKYQQYRHITYNFAGGHFKTLLIKFSKNQ
jgi:hypothetical protein